MCLQYEAEIQSFLASLELGVLLLNFNTLDDSWGSWRERIYPTIISN